MILKINKKLAQQFRNVLLTNDVTHTVVEEGVFDLPEVTDLGFLLGQKYEQIKNNHLNVQAKEDKVSSE